MNSAALPILYSFRRCPYAMRARMAVKAAGQTCELREVVLRDKPQEMLEASPKATVPVLVLQDGTVIDESFDVMMWALKASDPLDWLKPQEGTLDELIELIGQCEDDFKPHLDRYKYANRYEDSSPEEHRTKAEAFLQVLEERLRASSFLFGNKQSLADIGIAPFIRQFANTDRTWFDASPYPALQRWLADFIASETFTSIMSKNAQWLSGNEPLIFPV